MSRAPDVDGILRQKNSRQKAARGLLHFLIGVLILLLFSFCSSYFIFSGHTEYHESYYMYVYIYIERYQTTENLKYASILGMLRYTD